MYLTKWSKKNVTFFFSQPQKTSINPVINSILIQILTWGHWFFSCITHDRFKVATGMSGDGEQVWIGTFLYRCADGTSHIYSTVYILGTVVGHWQNAVTIGLTVILCIGCNGQVQYSLNKDCHKIQYSVTCWGYRQYSTTVRGLATRTSFFAIHIGIS